MGPLPLIAIAFVLGVCLARGDGAVSLGAVAAVLLASSIVLAKRWRSASSMALVCSALLVGLVRGREIPEPVPRARTPVDADLLRGRVVRGCEAADGEGVRCLVERDGDHARVALRASRCDARPGDRIVAVATLRALAPDANGARLGPGGAMFRRGVAFTALSEGCDRTEATPSVLDRARRAGLALRVALGAGLARGFDALGAQQARALLFGDEAGIETAQLEAFRLTGLAHVLAVSGAHVALLAALFGGLARSLARRVPWVASRGLVAAVGSLVPLPALGLFVLATGESASAMRSLLSAGLGAVALAAGRRAQGSSLVAASAIVTLALDPSLALDAGWQLSLAAAWALSLHRPDAHPSPKKRRLVASLVAIASEGLSASLRVALATAPILAWHFQRVPATALVANALAAPLAEAILLPSVLFVGLVGAVSARGAHVAGAVVTPVLASLFALPGLAYTLPFASLPVPPPTPFQAGILLATASMLLSPFARRTRAIALAAALALTAGAERVHRERVRPLGVLRVTAIDVGQGDAILIDLPDGAAMLVDAGGAAPGAPDPGARVVVPFLADRRRRELAVVVASHPHPDHVGGLPAVFQWAHVGEFWDTRQGESLAHPSDAWVAARREAQRAGVTLRGPESLCGPPRAFHGAVLEVLAPCPAVDRADPPNDASFVIRIDFGRGSVLLAGDLEARGEARVLARIRGPVTVLKVPHHGSRTSSTDAFLDALRPRVALISAGHPSPFEHPHDEAVGRLLARGAVILDTPTRGGVAATIRADGSVSTGWGAALDAP